jgi:hypothetical protein
MQPSEMEEGTAVLVARAKDGDEAAITLLYRRYVARIYAYALQRFEDRLRRPGSFEPGGVHRLKGLIADGSGRPSSIPH